MKVFIFSLFTLVASIQIAEASKRKPADISSELELSVHKKHSLRVTIMALERLQVSKTKSFYPLICKELGKIEGALGNALTDSQRKPYVNTVRAKLGDDVFSKGCIDDAAAEFDALIQRMNPAVLNELVKHFKAELQDLESR